MSIRIFDTMARQKVELEIPLDRPLLVYVCGVTVYDLCHLGHARSAIAFDIMVRYLRARGINVKFIKNFTDVDDKIINKALQEDSSPKEVAERYIQEYHQDMGAIGILRADEEPRVTRNMDAIIGMIERLEENGHAYVVDGDVYFEVTSFMGYGKLSGRNTEDMMSGARIEVDHRKRSPIDFALWKAAKPGEPQWDSPWGKGRPGWHIECSAMIESNFGQTIDIHGGGKDLVFPHHENEIAQSEAATGHTLAKHWVHNGFVNVACDPATAVDPSELSVKMSKSLGNFCTIKDALKLYHPQVLRYFMMATHYRSPITFSPDAVAEADRRLAYLYETLQRVDGALSDYDGPATPTAADMKSMHDAMDDDFNSAAVMGHLANLFKEANELATASATGAAGDHQLARLASIRSLVDHVAEFLGILDQEPEQYLLERKQINSRNLPIPEEEIEALLLERTEARKGRNWGEADRIRGFLMEKGITIKDSPEGTTWSVE